MSQDLTADEKRVLASLRSARAQALACRQQLVLLQERLLVAQGGPVETKVSSSLVTQYGLVLRLYGLVWAEVQRLLVECESWLVEPVVASSRVPELLRTRLDVRLEQSDEALERAAARFLTESKWSLTELEMQIREHSQCVLTAGESLTETLRAFELDERYVGRQALSPRVGDSERLWSVEDLLPTLRALDSGYALPETG
jgi:hypothetical protein